MTELQLQTSLNSEKLDSDSYPLAGDQLKTSVVFTCMQRSKALLSAGNRRKAIFSCKSHFRESCLRMGTGIRLRNSQKMPYVLLSSIVSSSLCKEMKAYFSTSSMKSPQILVRSLRICSEGIMDKGTPSTAMLLFHEFQTKAFIVVWQQPFIPKTLGLHCSFLVKL